MSKLMSLDALRTVGENAFEALVLVATVFSVAGTTISLCLAV